MNPFENINLNTDKNESIRIGIETEIKEFEDRILSVKREINNLEGLIEINTFYSNPATKDFLWKN